MKKNFYQLKVVKTRKPHDCIVCQEVIPKEARTLVESGFNEDEGYFANYFHIDNEHGCHLDYLDACQPNDLTIPDKLKNSNFFGELSYDRWRSVRRG